MMFKTIKDAWKYGVDAVLHRGDEIKDERGDNTLEYSNLVMTISNPLNSTNLFGFTTHTLNNPLEKGLWSNDEALKPYIDEFIEGDVKGFVYTYGNRLHSHFGVDQTEKAMDKLLDCRMSRRATCVTWNPLIDTVAEDVPCLIMVDFKFRKGKLQTTAVWRSHDIYGAYYPNVVGLAHLCAKMVEPWGEEVGSITTHSISAHIRESDFEDAGELVRWKC